jgi:hypothetical protein
MKPKVSIRSVFLACACACVFAFVGAAGFADNLRRILPYDSPVVAQLSSIYLEQGKVPLSSAGPYSLDEVSLMLERIDPDTLSTAGSRAYEEIAAAVREAEKDGDAGRGDAVKGNPISVAWHPSVALEGYLHTNQVPAETRWEYGYNQRQPLVSLPIEVSVGQGFFGAFDLNLKERHDTLNASLVASNPTNWYEDAAYIDLQFPFRAFVAAGGPNWSLSLGRDRFSWGIGQTGNLIVSDSPDYYDFARLTGYWRRFKYSGLWLGLASQHDVYNAPPVNSIAETYTNHPRNFLFHRIDIAVFDRLSVAIMEGILVGGVPLDLVYFNPVMIFHNLFRWHDASSILALEATFNPWRYMELYGEFVLNEFATGFERERYPADAIPNAFGCLAGVRARVPLGAGYLDGGGEFVYVNPWMYIRENDLTSYGWHRYQWSDVPGSAQWVSACLGYGEGPDSMVAAGWVGYEAPGAYSFGVDFRMSWKGINTLDTDWTKGADAAALVAPTGTPETRMVLHVRASVTPLSWLTIGCHLYGISTWSLGHDAGAPRSDDLQAVLSVKASLPSLAPSR